MALKWAPELSSKTTWLGHFPELHPLLSLPGPSLTVSFWSEGWGFIYPPQKEVSQDYIHVWVQVSGRQGREKNKQGFTLLLETTVPLEKVPSQRVLGACRNHRHHCHQQEIPVSIFKSELQGSSWSPVYPWQCPLLGFRLPWVQARGYWRGNQNRG